MPAVPVSGWWRDSDAATPARWNGEVLIMMVVELPDEIGNHLKAKAAVQGLTLEAWFQLLATSGVARSKPKKSAYGL